MRQAYAATRMVTKRDGTAAAWDRAKVRAAVAGALRDGSEGGDDDALAVAVTVERSLRHALNASGVSVELVQDECERQLMLGGYTRSAKAFILYREEHSKKRAAAEAVPEEFRRLARESRARFHDRLGELVYYRTYSRWREDLRRREAWPETVRRYFDFADERLGADWLTPDERGQVEGAVLAMDVMPSMRLMWSAGAAARASNVAAFNCSFVAPREPRDFAEVLYVLACGTGVGFAAESRNVGMLPMVRRQTGARVEYEVGDSKEGWAEALRVGLETWMEGGDAVFDFRGVRPAGARLLTMGGGASGPGPLMDMLKYARGLVLGRQGRRLSNLDVHDLVCKVGDCIVSGGVRRSALISLSDLDDDEIREAKSGPYGSWPRHRELANNSAVYERRPPATEFMREWLALAESGSGERGIFNRGGMLDQVPARRVDAWRDMGHVLGDTLLAQVGTNPCGEINLLHKQFCNLTEVVCRAHDTPHSLAAKVRIAAILGTYQSTLTDYPYLSKEWKENCERERLLGVSLTGQWDCAEIMGDSAGNLASMLREVAVGTNKGWAERLGVSESTAVTCGKPSGTVSQLVDAASGGHPRFAPFYIRRVLVSTTDPLCRLLRDAGVPCAPKVGEPADAASAWSFEFPVRAPAGSRCARDATAMDQLEHWLRMKECFTEHNPSVSVYVAPEEWFDVGHWVWRHFDRVGGLSFFPKGDGHVYPQAPYEEITEEEYGRRAASFPDVDYSLLAAYERDAGAEQGSKELACAAGACELP